VCLYVLVCMYTLRERTRSVKILFTIGYLLCSFNIVVAVEQSIPSIVHITMMNSASGKSIDKPMYTY
jgi:hypothetical protein